jgi:hypothetical protein
VVTSRSHRLFPSTSFLFLTILLLSLKPTKQRIKVLHHEQQRFHLCPV